MLKSGGHTLREVLINLYNAIIQPSSPSPDNWHHTNIKVLHKSGNPQFPQNYRPIATIPILYKLFARLLYNRLEPTLDNQQSCDQAGFRRERGTTNHLFTISILQEIADEWQIPLWVAAIDFKKAFDSVTHAAIWESLTEQGVHPSYVQLLSKLYNNQTAAVKTDVQSRLFNIERGTKQGDPLSSLLFNCVSESVMRKIKLKWNSKRWGLPLKPHHTDNTQLTNLRFADDLLLVATSLEHLTHMIGDLSTEAGKVGLQLHPDKTKILHNGHNTTSRARRRPPNNARIHNMTIDILPTTDATKYLGRKLSFHDPHRVEIESRISFAWKKFYTLKQELAGSRYSLTDRLRLFHGTVTPTILYGCEAWTLTTELENRLTRTQRQMLRMILHSPRRRHNQHNEHLPAHSAHNDNAHNTHDQPTEQPTTYHPCLRQADGLHAQPQTDSDASDSDVDSATSATWHHDQPDLDDGDATADLEPWVEWIKRCTHDVETRMRKLNLDDWIATQRRRKWRWVGKLAKTVDTDWMVMAMRWDPTIDSKLNARRRPGRPKTRWMDDVASHLRLTATDTEHDSPASSNSKQNSNDVETVITALAPIDHEHVLQMAADEAAWTVKEEGFVNKTL